MGILKKLWDMLPEGRPVWVPQPAEWGIKEEIMEKNEDEKSKFISYKISTTFCQL